LRDAHSEGRPQILDERADREVVRLLHDPSNGTTVAIGREMRSQGLNLSDDTIRRSLRRQGLKACMKTKKTKLLLTKKHKARRCSLAGMQLSWTGVMWFFLDESKFNLFSSDGRQYCWSGERLLDQHVQPTVKFCLNNHTTKSSVSFLCFIFDSFFIDIFGYEFCAICLLELCDLMLNFL